MPNPRAWISVKGKMTMTTRGSNVSWRSRARDMAASARLGFPNRPHQETSLSTSKRGSATPSPTPRTLCSARPRRSLLRPVLRRLRPFHHHGRVLPARSRAPVMDGPGSCPGSLSHLADDSDHQPARRWPNRLRLRAVVPSAAVRRDVPSARGRGCSAVSAADRLYHPAVGSPASPRSVAGRGNSSPRLMWQDRVCTGGML
jgi:hypothetical protein